MNRALIFALKTTRKIIGILENRKSLNGRNWDMFSNKQYSNDLIYNMLTSDKPCMIARFGATEMRCLVNYLGVKAGQSTFLDYVKGKSIEWWWEPQSIKQLQVWSGFFPSDVDKVEQFCELMMADMKNVDLLGSWLKEERYFVNSIPNVKRVVLEDLEPFFSQNPWTRALEGQRVLVVHPFAETIESQFNNRELLFDNNLLPDFQLLTVKAVQSVAGEVTPYSDWFEALQYMKDEIDKKDYDICIIGCGAYGFPLAAHVKRRGKKSIHLAGSTQLLFGIKGKRWEEFIVWPYTNLFNQYWVRPGEKEKPKNAVIVEDACYW